LNKEYNNIIFISSEWEGYHRREFTEELYKKINSWSNVLIVQLPVSLFVHFFTNFKTKILSLFLGKFKTKKLDDAVFLFTPVIFFHYLLWLKFKPFAQIDSFLIKQQINYFIRKKFGLSKNLVWLFLPQVYQLAETLNYKYLIYDFYDNYDYDYSGNLLGKESHFNELLIKKSNLVICTSIKMFDRAKKVNNNSVYLPNGNSYKKIVSALYADVPFNKKRKVIGYIGAYRNWSDFSIVESAIEKIKDADFVFVGPIHPTAVNAYEKLKTYSNFFHFPQMPFEKAAGFLKLFDVGIIPFKINRFTEGVFPNKFFEYLAAGVPVVSTALPDLKKFNYGIYYSADNNDFLKGLTKIVEGEISFDKEEMQKIAFQNSWKNRIAILDDYLQKLIHNKL
jgi:glycosyltransferase involved in cell wall biosynthesis